MLILFNAISCHAILFMLILFPIHSMQICQVQPIAGKRRFAAFGGGGEGLMRFPETQNAHRPLLSNNQCLRKISYIMRGFSFQPML
jgi:hypothetical protein